jgi:hypothetical protein
MERNDFLNKFKDQVEYIGKDGIIGIMKSAHFEINKSKKKKKIKKNNIDYNLSVNLKSIDRKNEFRENKQILREKSENNITKNNNKNKLNNQNLISRNITYTPIKAFSKIKINFNSKNFKTEKNNSENKKDNKKINKKQTLDLIKSTIIKKNNNNKDNKISKSFITRNPGNKINLKASFIRKKEVYSPKKQNNKVNLSPNKNDKNIKDNKINNNQKDKKNNEFNNKKNNQNKQINHNIKTLSNSEILKNQNSKVNESYNTSKSSDKSFLPLLKNNNKIILKNTKTEENLKLPKISIKKYNSSPIKQSQPNKNSINYIKDKFKDNFNYINDIEKKTHSLISNYQNNLNKYNFNNHSRSINITMPNSNIKNLGIIKEEDEGNILNKTPQRKEENNNNSKNKYFNFIHEDNTNNKEDNNNDNNNNNNNNNNETSDIEKLILQRQSYSSEFSFLF